MSVDAGPGGPEAGTVGATASGAAVAGADGGTGGRDDAGLLFARLSVLPALLAAAWLIPGFLLLAAGYFKPAPVTILAVVCAVPLLYYGLRAVPALPGPEAYALPVPAAGTRNGQQAGRTPWWTLGAVLVIVVAFFADQVAFHSQFVIISRDPGAYYQFGAWIAGHGSLPVPADAAAFGGTHNGALTFGSYATYQVGNSVVLQFMAGLPMVLAGVMWAAGYHVTLLMAPLLGALAVLSFAGLAARLLGPRWAPLAALIVAVSLPMQFTSRSTYSEPLAEILFIGGLSLVFDSLRDRARAGAASAGASAEAGGASAEAGGASAEAGGAIARAQAAVRRRVRVAAGLGGLLLGLTVLARIDGASDFLPVIPYCGALFVRRRPQAAPLTIGLVIGAGLGIWDGLGFSWPYLMQTNRSSVLPLAAITALVIALTVLLSWYYRHQPLPHWWGWLQKAALVVPFLIIVIFVLRPYFQHVKGINNNNHLVRTYAELALHWVDWYLGAPIIALATIGAALLGRKVLRGEARMWVLPLMVFSWAIVEFLYQPGISPDQPWASRRLVPEVMPAFVLLAVWAVARGSAWLRDHGYLGVPRNAAVAVCGLAVLAPAVVTNWGLGISTSHGIAIHANGLADKRTFQGELSGMDRLCADLPAKASVVVIDWYAAGLLLQDIRTMCGVPAASYLHDNGNASAKPADAPTVLAITRDIERAGRVPVLLAGHSYELQPYRDSGDVRHLFTLNTTRDAGVIYHPPANPIQLTIDVWMWTPSSKAPSS